MRNACVVMAVKAYSMAVSRKTESWGVPAEIAQTAAQASAAPFVTLLLSPLVIKLEEFELEESETEESLAAAEEECRQRAQQNESNSAAATPVPLSRGIPDVW